MSDTFYRVALGDVFARAEHTIDVGTSTSGSYFLELRVRDGQCTAQQVREFLEKMEHIFAVRDNQVIAAGTLVG